MKHQQLSSLIVGDQKVLNGRCSKKTCWLGFRSRDVEASTKLTCPSACRFQEFLSISNIVGLNQPLNQVQKLENVFLGCAMLYTKHPSTLAMPPCCFISNKNSWYVSHTNQCHSCLKCFTCITTFNPHNSPLKKLVLLLKFYRYDN